MMGTSNVCEKVHRRCRLQPPLRRHRTRAPRRGTRP